MQPPGARTSLEAKGRESRQQAGRCSYPPNPARFSPKYEAALSEAKEPAPGTEVCYERLQLPNAKVCCKVRN